MYNAFHQSWFHRKVNLQCAHNVQLSLTGKPPPWRSYLKLTKVKLLQSQDPEVLPPNSSNNPHTTPEPILILLFLSHNVWKQKNLPTATLGNVCLCACISFKGLGHSPVLHSILLEHRDYIDAAQRAYVHSHDIRDLQKAGCLVWG